MKKLLVGTVLCGLVGCGGSSDGKTEPDSTIKVDKQDVVAVHSLSGGYGGGAFAALRQDGSIVTWGNTEQGGDSSLVAHLIDGSNPAISISSSNFAFSALMENGSVVSWGDEYGGGDYSNVEAELYDIESITPSHHAFSALRDDNIVVVWGAEAYIQNGHFIKQLPQHLKVNKIVASMDAFAALMSDGSVETWGYEYYGGDSIAYYRDHESGTSEQVDISAKINGQNPVVELIGTLSGAFIAIREDGSIVSWGSVDLRNEELYLNGSDESTSVKKIYSDDWHNLSVKLQDNSFRILSDYTYSDEEHEKVLQDLDGSSNDKTVNEVIYGYHPIVLKENGELYKWTVQNDGRDEWYNWEQAFNRNDIVDVVANQKAFVATTKSSALISWGFKSNGGDIAERVGFWLSTEGAVKRVVGLHSSFAIIKDNGNAVVYGRYYDDNEVFVEKYFTEVQDITTSDGTGFAVLRFDGSVITFGNPNAGGDSSRVAKEIDGIDDNE